MMIILVVWLEIKNIDGVGAIIQTVAPIPKLKNGGIKTMENKELKNYEIVIILKGCLTSEEYQ